MMTKNEKISKSMLENLNAEKYSEEKAVDIFLNAVSLTFEDDSLDFIGTVFKNVGLTRGIADHLVRRFPETLTSLKETIKFNCESNCYENGKKGKINSTMALANLNSNHDWYNKNETKQEQTIKIENLPDELNELLDDGE